MDPSADNERSFSPDKSADGYLASLRNRVDEKWSTFWKKLPDTRVLLSLGFASSSIGTALSSWGVVTQNEILSIAGLAVHTAAITALGLSVGKNISQR